MKHLKKAIEQYFHMQCCTTWVIPIAVRGVFGWRLRDLQCLLARLVVHGSVFNQKEFVQKFISFEDKHSWETKGEKGNMVLLNAHGYENVWVFLMIRQCQMIPNDKPKLTASRNFQRTEQSTYATNSIRLIYSQFSAILEPHWFKTLICMQSKLNSLVSVATVFHH